MHERLDIFVVRGHIAAHSGNYQINGLRCSSGRTTPISEVASDDNSRASRTLCLAGSFRCLLFADVIWGLVHRIHKAQYSRRGVITSMLRIGLGHVIMLVPVSLWKPSWQL